MRVAACLVTRGNVPMDEILQSIPDDWEIVVWDNSKREDLAVYGRYAAIDLTDADVIYVQDDDAVLPPEGFEALLAAHQPGVLVSNMPERFRHSFYADHCLVGFGAIFDRDLPREAFRKFFAHVSLGQMESFHRTCDIPFTTLTPHVLVGIEHRDLPWANAPDRMWMQKETHVPERTQTLHLARMCR